VRDLDGRVRDLVTCGDLVVRAGADSTDCQYSSANMMVMTRSVTDGSEGSGE
jgi:hypothetical protein